MIGVIGKKIGMTQIYSADNSAIPVTVVQVVPNLVSAVRTDDKNGYRAIQLSAFDQKEQRLNNSEKVAFQKIKQTPKKVIKEFRTDRAGDYVVGMTVGLGGLKVGDKIDVTGTSKGKGFQGVMKRHNFAGGRDSHGASVSHRVPGSIGQRTYPGRVIKGKKMPGHMGNKSATVQNLEIAAIESDQSLLLIKGAVPGAKNSYVHIYPHSVEFENALLKAQMTTTDVTQTAEQSAQ